MTPYTASGRTAACKLNAQDQRARDARVARLRNSLRSFKAVITTVCTAGIVLTPSIGLVTQSGSAALITALLAFAIAAFLELLEGRVKRELTRG